MSEKTKAQRTATKAGAIDELALQNAIRYRHKQDWPDTILQLTKRIAAVNQTWAQIIMRLMTIEGLSISWKKEVESLVLTVTFVQDDEDGTPIEEIERHVIHHEQLHDARQYIEVLLMDKLDHSELIARVDPQQEQTP